MRGVRDPSLWLALGCGAALRLIGLGGPSLWLDEAISARTASLGAAAIVEAARHDLHPPGYYLLLSAWSSLWPVNAAGLPTEWALRSLSALASLALLPIVYGLGAAWADGPEERLRAARWALWLTALSPFAVALAREARAYSLLAAVLAAQLALWSSLRARGGGPVRWVLLGLLLAAGFYLQYHALLFALALAVAGLRGTGASPGFRRGWNVTLALASVPMLVWAPAVAAQWSRGVRGWLPFRHSPLVVLRTITGFFRGADAGWLQLSLWAVPVLFLLAAGSRRGAGPLALCLLLPMLAAYAISILGAPVFEARYLAGSAVAAWVLAARGIGAARGRPAAWRLGAAGLVLGGMALGVLPVLSTGAARGEDWRGLVDAMARRSEPGTPVLFAFEVPVEPFSYYAAGGPLRGVGALRPGGGEAVLSDELERAAAGAPRLWYVTYLEGVYDPQKRIRTALRDRGFEPAGEALQAGSLTALPLARGAGS